MKYAVVIGSSVMIHIPSFMKTGSDMQKLVGVEGFADTQHGDCVSLMLFFFSK
jgi:hypothetical protein